MILMKINTHDYENDVRVMTLAFFPGEKIVIEEQDYISVRVFVNVENNHIVIDVSDGKN